MQPTFKTLNDAADPTFNQLLGINNGGRIAGYFGSGQPGHPNKGYTLDAPYSQGNYHNENFPGSVQTQVTGINGHNRTVGFWADAAGNNFGFVENNGTFTNVVDPKGKGAAAGGATVEQLLGVNDNDKAVGFWTDANGNAHGFTYDVGSKSFAEVNIAGHAGTTTTAINDQGHIAGFVTDNGIDEGFIKNGNKVELLRGPKGATSVMALGINNEDQVVGSYTDGAGNTHGFLFDDATKSYTTIDDPNAKGMTVVNGLNDKGQLVGFYLDAAGNTDGMLVQVTPPHHS